MGAGLHNILERILGYHVWDVAGPFDGDGGDGQMVLKDIYPYTVEAAHPQRSDDMQEYMQELDLVPDS